MHVVRPAGDATCPKALLNACLPTFFQREKKADRGGRGRGGEMCMRGREKEFVCVVLKRRSVRGCVGGGGRGGGANLATVNETGLILSTNMTQRKKKVYD